MRCSKQAPSGRRGINRFFLHQVDRTAAESAAHHARPDHRIVVPDLFHQEIQFGTADLVLAAEAFVGPEHFAAEGGQGLGFTGPRLPPADGRSLLQ